jgi:hypothetical protein
MIQDSDPDLTKILGGSERSVLPAEHTQPVWSDSIACPLISNRFHRPLA